MNFFSNILLLLLVAVLGASGYYYLAEVQPLQKASKDLQMKNQELIFQMEQLGRRNDSLSDELEKRVLELSEEKNQEIDRLKETYGDLLSSMKSQIERGEVTITRLADRLNVKIVDAIIFPSGKAELTLEGKKVLQKVGDIIGKAEGKHVKVAGHTDNVPIHPNLSREFASNWELSTARATNVVRFLSEAAGIDPGNLEAAGFASYQPAATNRTRRGRAQNRRIEILLTPKATRTKSNAAKNK